jgi:hypothetical protein
MSYPKVPPKPHVSTASKLSEERRARLLKLQEREELKGLLITKFKAKYGAKINVEAEVDNFMKNNTLTESNLRILDERLKSQAQAGTDIQPPTPPQPRSEKAPSAKASSIKSAPRSHISDDDQMSVTSSRSKQSSVYIPADDENQWAEILSHDTLLYREEERARMQREAENKLKLQRELERQLVEQEERKRREKEEDMMYEAAQRKNVETLETKEIQKTDQHKQKIMQEKQLRDKQMQEEKRRKREDERQQKAMDDRTVKRLQEELTAEQRAAEQRRKDEMTYLQKMMEENEANKRLQRDQYMREREQDIKSMEDYARMLDKQEEDRLNEIKAREQRQQLLMARMADTVLKEQSQKAREEDLLMLKQIEEREILDRAEDERRRARLREEQDHTKEFLIRQMREKEERKEAERRSLAEQADMWKQDSDEFFRIEEEKKRRQKEYNLAQAEALKQQIQEKALKKRKVRMDHTELALNKQLLKEIRKGKEEGLAVQGQALQ